MLTSSLITTDREKAERKYYARTCYMTKAESELVAKAARFEGKSVSAFISEAVLERSIKLMRLENCLTSAGERRGPEPVSHNCDSDLSANGQMPVSLFRP